MTPYHQTDWYKLAEKAGTEMDPDKLISLVDELNRALEQNERTSLLLRTKPV